MVWSVASVNDSHLDFARGALSATALVVGSLLFSGSSTV